MRRHRVIGSTAIKRQRETEGTLQNQAQNVECNDLESKKEA